MDLRLKVLKESNKTKFDSYSVRNSVLIISHNQWSDGSHKNRHEWAEITGLSFTQLRLYCSKKNGRTFHVTTADNITGEAVVQYFSG